MRRRFDANRWLLVMLAKTLRMFAIGLVLLLGLLFYAVSLGGCTVEEPERLGFQRDLEPIAKPAPPPTEPVIVREPGVPAEAYRYQRDLVRNARIVWGLEAPVATFAAQIHQESTYRAEAVSHAGAAGLAQFMPATARWISGAYPAELGEADPMNPSWALRAMVRYDRHLWDRISIYSTDCDRMLFTLSDYNGGSGWRMKRQRLSDEPGRFAVASRVNPGIHALNQKENQEYPLRILARQPLYRAWGSGACT